MPSTPTSKLSTLSKEELAKAELNRVAKLVTDADYRSLLIELLAVIHRDGGQYTNLAGLAVSFVDAEAKVINDRKKLSSMLFSRKT